MPKQDERQSELSRCRSCGEYIVWTMTEAGNRTPVNLDGTTHFATCPDAKEWSRKKNRRATKPHA